MPFEKKVAMFEKKVGGKPKFEKKKRSTRSSMLNGEKKPFAKGKREEKSLKVDAHKKKPSGDKSKTACAKRSNSVQLTPSDLGFDMSSVLRNATADAELRKLQLELDQRKLALEEAKFQSQERDREEKRQEIERDREKREADQKVQRNKDDTMMQFMMTMMIKFADQQK